VGLAGAGVADEAEREPFPDPVAGGEGVDDGGVDAGVEVEVEGAQRFLAGEPGGLDLALGAAAGAVVVKPLSPARSCSVLCVRTGIGHRHRCALYDARWPPR